jgi:hypothetical protein
VVFRAFGAYLADSNKLKTELKAKKQKKQSKSREALPFSGGFSLFKKKYTICCVHFKEMSYLCTANFQQEWKQEK